MLKLIILDLDDTIINYTYANTIAFNTLIDTISDNIKMNNDEIINIHKKIKKNLYKIYDNQFVRHDKLLQIKLLCNELKINSLCDILELYQLYENTYLNNISLHEKCIEFLEICNKKNIKTVILSNNLLDIQLKVCNKLGLDNYINSLFTSHEFFYEKPDNESLMYILNYYNVKNQEVIIIGDSIKNDIQLGINNNIKTILCDNISNKTSFENCINIINSIDLSI